MKKKYYDNYPPWIIILTNLFAIAVYFAGAYIMFTLNLITGIIYVAYIILLEFFVYKEACPHCFYYGKACAFGKGILASLILKKGNPKKFCEREIKAKDFIPQILVVLVPLIVGIAILISRGFNIYILIALLYPIFSWFVMNPIIYGKLACPHCKQGKICCPALKFFSKGKK
jgi:hypothetical protein